MMHKRYEKKITNKDKNKEQNMSANTSTYNNKVEIVFRTSKKMSIYFILNVDAESDQYIS